jgi:hypothetical protein
MSIRIADGTPILNVVSIFYFTAEGTGAKVPLIWLLYAEKDIL